MEVTESNIRVKEKFRKARSGCAVPTMVWEQRIGGFGQGDGERMEL